MYELATGHWLFPQAKRDDLSRDVVHLNQMVQRTGKHHDEEALRQYQLRHGLKGVYKFQTCARNKLIPFVCTQICLEIMKP
jgi:hypothetical protein